MSSFTIVNALKFFSRGEKWTSRIKKEKNICEMKNFYYFCNVVMPYSAGM